MAIPMVSLNLHVSDTSPTHTNTEAAAIKRAMSFKIESGVVQEENVTAEGTRKEKEKEEEEKVEEEREEEEGHGEEGHGEDDRVGVEHVELSVQQHGGDRTQLVSLVHNEEDLQ